MANMTGKLCRSNNKHTFLFIVERIGQMVYALFILVYFSESVRKVETMLTLSSLIVPLIDLGSRPSFLASRYSLSRSKTIYLALLIGQITFISLAFLLGLNYLIKFSWIFSRALNIAVVQFAFVAMRFIDFSAFRLSLPIVVSLLSSIPLVGFDLGTRGLLFSSLMLFLSTIIITESLSTGWNFSVIKSTVRFSLFKGFPIVANVFLVTVSLNGIRLLPSIEQEYLINLGYIQRASIVLPFLASIMVNRNLRKVSEIEERDKRNIFVWKMILLFFCFGFVLIVLSAVFFGLGLNISFYDTLLIMLPFLLLGKASILEMALNLLGRQKYVLYSGVTALVVAICALILLSPPLVILVFSFVYLSTMAFYHYASR